MKKRDTSYSGWVIVGVSFITLALAYGVWYSFSVFFVPLLDEFDCGRSVLSGAFSLCISVHSLAGLFVGRLVDRLGPRRVIVLGSLSLGIGLALCSLTKTWWQFYIFFGVITAVGIGAIGWVPNVTLIQQWFREKRGLAIGIISSGIGIGILVCIPTIQYLIIRFGWGTTYNIMAISFPAIIIFMAAILIKKPVQAASSDKMETKLSHRVTKDPLIIDEAWASVSWTLQKAVATKQFWLLGTSFFLGSLVIQSVFAHQVAFFVDCGLDPLFASYIFGIVGMVSLGGKILWGALSDKIGREVTYAMGITCYIFGVITLIVLNISPYPSLPYLFALFFGMGYSVSATLPPLIAGDLFSGYAFGGIFGSIMVFNGVGGAFGAWFAGFIYDVVGNYLPFFVILIIFALFSSLSIWWLAPRKIRRVPGRIRYDDGRIGQ